MQVVLDKKNMNSQEKGRKALEKWQQAINKNIYVYDADFRDLINAHFKTNFSAIDADLSHFAEIVISQLEPLVAENNQNANLPHLKHYNALGMRIDEVIHHGSYIAAGNIIYQSRLLERLTKPGGLTECLAFLFLSSATGEAGHNCPIACSAGIIRVLQQLPHMSHRDFFLDKLILPSFTENYTGAQFVTEIQGGSDVGQNVVFAVAEKDHIWRIYGEKWFCSNANADLMFVMARYDKALKGTKGLALFLVPALWDKTRNQYFIHRLKDKLGTRSMATAEIEFNGAYAYQVGALEDGFHLAMNSVLHTSRLFNSVCVLAMARRAFWVAYHYAKEREAFGQTIIHYPLVKENLSIIKAENTAMLAAIFATAALQDTFDSTKEKENKQQNEIKLLLRLLVNMQKYYTAKKSVEHIHHALDVLAGNGTIETFSSLPRLLRDCIICENWEGTHNVIHAQILKDIGKYHVDEIFVQYIANEIKSLPANLTYTNDLTSALTKLRENLKKFKKNDLPLQSLLINELVAAMASLHCAAMLLKEATRDGVTDAAAHSKLACYQLYRDRCVVQSVTRDAAYLDLLNKIL